MGQKQDALQFASPQKAYHYLKTGEEKNQLCYANCLLNSVTRVASDSDIEPWIEKHNPSVQKIKTASNKIGNTHSEVKLTSDKKNSNAQVPI